MSSVNNVSGGVPAVTAADINEHTIQAVIELVYVRTANEIINSALVSLEQALATTKSALDTLTSLQSLHNYIAPVSKGNFNFDYAGGAYYSINASGVSVLVNSTGDFNTYMKRYNSIASSFYGEKVSVFMAYQGQAVTPTSPIFVQMQTQLAQYKSILSGDIAYLELNTPPLANGSTDPNSLLAKLKLVYADLPGGSFASINSWVLDQYNNTGSASIANAGQIQNHIQAAMTAAQSLNGTQSQKVQAYMTFFQQYYQSATNILQAISQIIQSMAQNAGRAA